MTWRAPVTISAIALALFLSIGCDEDPSVDADGDVDTDTDGDADADGDVDADADLDTDDEAEADGAVDADPDVEAEAPRRWRDVSPVFPPLPDRRSVHRMVYDSGRGLTLMVAGQPYSATPIGDIWSWDGDQWTELTPGANPLPERKNFGLLYDPVSGQALAMGGIYGGLYAERSFYDDLWAWTGETWVDLGPAEGAERPSPRSGHGFALDVARGRAVLFGGGSESPTAETWEWDGVQWQDRTPEVVDGTESPGRRFNTALAYDEARGRMVLFGGQDGEALDDTWEWDGERWAQIVPEGEAPPARGFHALVYDSNRQRVVLYGGTSTYPPFITESNTFADHWEWDGVRWTQVGDGDGPGHRSGHAMAFDPVRDRLILMGGGPDGETAFNDIWELGPEG